MDVLPLKTRVLFGWSMGRGTLHAALFLVYLEPLRTSQRIYLVQDTLLSDLSAGCHGPRSSRQLQHHP